MAKLQVLNIIYQTGSDGPGLRNSLYLAGCPRRCPGCHNPGSWDPKAGRSMSIKEIMDEIMDPYSDITISGGEPLLQAEVLLELLKSIKQRDPKKNIWVYTGYLLQELYGPQRECLNYIDVLVDGPYKQEQRDLSRFCGSKNQRIIHLTDGKITKIE